MNTNEKYMKRCLELAKNGLPAAMPNPSVGAVIVHNDTIIGEGFTAAYGGAHAEVNAIQAVKDKSLLSKSTIYVSLEPCNHFGKTPPCCDLILKYNIPNIVVGILDSNKIVAGSGIKKLVDAGRSVTVGVLELDCYQSNRRFFTFHNKQRPYIVLKWAESQDGFIAPKKRSLQQPVWITNAYSRQLVHKWRSEEQSVLIGTQTALDDNPALTTRDWMGKNPIRVVLDKKNRIPKESQVRNDQAETIVLSENEIDFTENFAQNCVAFLYQKNIQSVLIEGGSKTLQAFIDANLWDEARVFVGTPFFGEGTKAPVFNKKWQSKSKIQQDELILYSND